jgi:hypothetical protein
MKINEITKDDLNSKYDNFLTVGKIKDFLNKYNLPNNAKVFIQRVEDIYYEKNGWSVLLKVDDFTVKDENGNFIKETMEQYTPAWDCVKYNDENDILFIDLHY